MSGSQLSLFDNEGHPVLNELYQLFPDNESVDLEYKSAANGFPNSFWSTYSAFANTQGGVVVMGVREKKGSFQIEGLDVEQIKNYKKLFWDEVNNLTRVNRNLLKDGDIKEISLQGKRILAFNIPGAQREEKPIYLTRNPFGNTYKRNYEGDYKCSDEEVRRMLADADRNLHHDSRILENYTIEDIDIDSIRKYRQVFSSDKPTHPWLVLSDLELLRQLGGYRRDRVSKKEGFTLAGILMFGKSLSIADQEAAPNFFPDYREALSDDPDLRWTDRIYPDGTWEANLFQFYMRVWPIISGKLPRPFALEDGRRKEESSAHVALREAFVNTLVHADYSAPGSIIIELTREMFRFSNPGTLLVSLHQYYEGGISECRNPNIQKMFMMMGGAEKAGSGVNKIFSGWDQAHWQTPYLKIQIQPDRVELNLPQFSILPQNTLLRLQQLFGEDIQHIGKNQLTILAICEIEGEVNNTRLQYALDLHKTDITSCLQDLCRRGYLESENKGRWTSYHLNVKSELGVDSFTSKVDTSERDVDNSRSKVDTSDTKVDTSTSKVDTSDAKVDTSTIVADTDKPEVINYKKRMSLNELEQSIIEFCAKDYRTLEEIAVAIRRETNYIKNKIIPDMVKQNKLEKKFPHTPNHPGQAYKGIEEQLKETPKPNF